MALPPAVKLSGSLALSEIATTFGETTGTARSMGVHSDQAWFVDGVTSPTVPAFEYYGTAGSYSYIMPWHTGDVVIEAWGAGGGGDGVGSNGSDGGTTTVNVGGTTTLSAGGGKGGNISALGGVASGGDVNTNGNVGTATGADAPNGGKGGASGSARGESPGAGGADADPLPGAPGGGGSGAYVRKTMSIDTETSISITVGTGGTAGTGGGAGAPGAVKISYTTADLTISYFPTTNIKFSQFYGKQGADPSGSGTTTYNTTPQTSYSFVVPLYRTSLQIDAFGAGGGATSPSYAGGATTVVKTGLNAFTMTAAGGGGGGAGGSRAIGGSGSGGAASGGDINLRGGDGAGTTTGGASGGYPSYGGGAGGPYPGNTGNYGAGGVPGGGASGFLVYDGSKYPAFSGAGGGGGGGFVRKTFTPANLRAGSVLQVNVGAGTSGGGAGRVVITWSSPA